MKCDLDAILLDLAELTRCIYKAEENLTEDNQRALSDQLAYTTLAVRKRFEIISASYLLSEVRAQEKYKKQFENENN